MSSAIAAEAPGTVNVISRASTPPWMHASPIRPACSGVVARITATSPEPTIFWRISSLNIAFWNFRSIAQAALSGNLQAAGIPLKWFVSSSQGAPQIMKRFLPLLLTVAAFGATPTYKVITKIKIGGAARWDYAYLDSANHRLYVSHGTQ